MYRIWKIYTYYDNRSIFEIYMTPPPPPTTTTTTTTPPPPPTPHPPTPHPPPPHPPTPAPHPPHPPPTPHPPPPHPPPTPTHPPPTPTFQFFQSLSIAPPLTSNPGSPWITSFCFGIAHIKFLSLYFLDVSCVGTRIPWQSCYLQKVCVKKSNFHRTLLPLWSVHVCAVLPGFHWPLWPMLVLS